MALVFSPKPQVFLVLDPVTNLPLTGGAGGMTFEFYAKDDGTPIGSHPSITEIGGGQYKFSASFSDPTHGICWVISTGANPAYVSGYLRPEDYFSDYTQSIYKIETNKWQIFTSGPNANTLCFFDDDGTTILYQFDLADSADAPTSTTPFKRTPV